MGIFNDEICMKKKVLREKFFLVKSSQTLTARLKKIPDISEKVFDKKLFYIYPDDLKKIKKFYDF